MNCSVLLLPAAGWSCFLLVGLPLVACWFNWHIHQSFAAPSARLHRLLLPVDCCCLSAYSVDANFLNFHCIAVIPSIFCLCLCLLLSIHSILSFISTVRLSKSIHMFSLPCCASIWSKPLSIQVQLQLQFVKVVRVHKIHIVRSANFFLLFYG